MDHRPEPELTDGNNWCYTLIVVQAEDDDDDILTQLSSMA